MNTKTLLAILSIALSATACTTGKTVKSLEDIQDDGERSVVLLTHDLKVYTTEKHSTVRSALLTFRCPSVNDKFAPVCFSVSLPYRGTKQIDGFGLHAFEDTSAKAVKIKYDNYYLQAAEHKIVIDKVPETHCRTSRKTRKPVCTTTRNDVSATYKVNFPSPAAMRVQPGPGCYLGHLSLSMVDNRILEFKHVRDSPLTIEKLSNMPYDIATELLRVVNKPC